MLNQVILVGRLTKNPEIIETESGKKMTYINIAVQRPFKNVDGLYDTDFISCVLWNSIAENTVEYTKTGDVIGVKGRIQTNRYEDDKGNINYVTEIITFLSSSSQPKE